MNLFDSPNSFKNPWQKQALSPKKPFQGFAQGRDWSTYPSLPIPRSANWSFNGFLHWTPTALRGNTSAGVSRSGTCMSGSGTDKGALQRRWGPVREQARQARLLYMSGRQTRSASVSPSEWRSDGSWICTSCTSNNGSVPGANTKSSVVGSKNSSAGPLVTLPQFGRASQKLLIVGI